jgi:hypothetical protein
MDLPFLTNLSNIDLLILIGAGVLFLVMAYMIFKQVMKAVIVGVISASIPVVLYLLGFNIDISLQTIIWFGLAGIATYFIYDVIIGWTRLFRIITWPIRWLWRRGDSKPKNRQRTRSKKARKKKRIKPLSPPQPHPFPWNFP